MTRSAVPVAVPVAVLAVALAAAAAPAVARTSPAGTGEGNRQPTPPAVTSPAPPSAHPTSPTTAAPTAPPNVWSPAEVQAEQARCKVALNGVSAVMIPETPIREGRDGSCGSAVVYKLMSIGKSPAVAISPPATLTCDMVGALHTWVAADLQPLARKHLGGPIVKIINMSSYSCRNAYGRKLARLSEHGRANALDIAGFETAKAGPTLVLNAWGPTGREIKALAAKAEAERRAAEAKSAAQKSKAASAPGARPGTPATGASSAAASGSSLLPAGAPGLVIQLPSPGGASSSAFGEPSRLGGPKADAKADRARRPSASPSPAPDLASRQTIFIRKAHETGCKRFRTMLGPETNRAHKNHFHIDMAERRNGSSYCE